MYSECVSTFSEADAYLHAKWHLNASSRLATIKMGRKFLEALPQTQLPSPLGEGSWVPI